METITIDGVEYTLTPVDTHSDFRLPTIQELATLINYDKFEPASNLDDTISYYYWSSTTDASSTTDTWVASFKYGGQYSNFKTGNYYVRCVRDGKDGLEWSASSTDTMTWDEANKYAEELTAPVYYKG